MQRTRGVNAGMAECAFQIRDSGPLTTKNVPFTTVDKAASKGLKLPLVYSTCG